MRDVDRNTCDTLVIPEGEEIDADLHLVLDCWNLFVCDRVLDLLEPFFGEQGLVPLRSLRVFIVRMKRRQQCISKASIISVVDIDDRMLLCEEGWELSILETSQRDILDNAEICLDDLVEDQAREVTIEVNMTLTKHIDE